MAAAAVGGNDNQQVTPAVKALLPAEFSSQGQSQHHTRSSGAVAAAAAIPNNA